MNIHKPKSQYLVFTSAGDNSNLHDWLEGNRNFDLWVSYYGSEQGRYKDVSDYYITKKGGKFPALHYVYQHWKEILDQYKAILVMDDDIIINASAISRLFEIHKKYDLWLLQPTFDPQGKISHTITITNPDTFIRYTNFVEMGCPLFRKDKLDKFMKVFDPILVGWGTDLWFMEVLGPNIEGKVAMVDEISCINPHDNSKNNQREIDQLQKMADRIKNWKKIKKKHNLQNDLGGFIEYSSIVSQEAILDQVIQPKNEKIKSLKYRINLQDKAIHNLQEEPKQTTHLKNYFKQWERMYNKVCKAKEIFSKLQELIKTHYIAMKHSFDLKLKQNNLSHIEGNDILLFSTMKNETFRLPYFLKYYRDLGVAHFIFVDNDSTDGMMELLKDQKDITVYYTNKSYKESNFGVYWLNHLLSKHGSNHWCLTCDPDEFLVYPYIESRDLNDLTNHLDAQHLRSLCAPLIDMYSNTYIHETYYKPADNPMQICPYFDKSGYIIKGYDANYRYNGLKGGVRQRVFNVENPRKSPELNKIPLVKWKKHYAYLYSTHVAIPRFLNKNNKSHLTTGALLHFKFLNQIVEKINIELAEKQHWDDSYEYKQYNKVFKEEKLLYDKAISIKYENWYTLEDLGLLNRGKW